MKNLISLASVNGLKYLPSYISEAEENALLRAIDQEKWMTGLRRRVQHYGYEYDYKARTVLASMYLGPLPNWVSDLATRLCREGVMPDTPDQVIVNEYLPGQGISRHVDGISCFGPVIGSLSLGSQCIMNLYSPENLLVELALEGRSLVTFSGEARYLWAHAIPARQSDVIQSRKVLRQRRVSLTFRKII